MNKLSELLTELDSTIAGLIVDESLTGTSVMPDGLIDVRKYHNRKSHVRMLADILSRMSITTNNLSNLNNNMIKDLNDDMSAMKKMIDDDSMSLTVTPKIAPVSTLTQHAVGASTRLPAPPSDEIETKFETAENSWSVVARGTKHKSNIIVGQHVKHGVSKVWVTEQHYINAVIVGTFADAKMLSGADNRLYYIDNADHFAVTIAGMFLHGNIGRIYTNEKEPTKIKNCKYVNSCNQVQCNYYHNPELSFGKDRRNYIASQWMYQQTVPAMPVIKKRSRRFGCIDYIDEDIKEMNGELIERFHDQTMHDLLCSVLLAQIQKE